MKVDIAPMGKPRMVRSDKWAKRDCVQRYWSYKDEIRIAMKKQKFKPGPCLEMIFEIPMPKSWSKKKKGEKVNTPHESRPDLDNLAKAVMDAFFEEDSHVHKLELEKVWAEEGCVIINNI